MRFAGLALFAAFLSCQTATQIRVKLRGVGVTCPSGASPTIEQTGLLAKRKLQSPTDMPELGVVGEECTAEGSVVALGDIVLVPADGPGPVEVLALGALKIGDAPAATAEACRAEYERLFGEPCEVGEGRICESCIFARRSVAFVKRSKLEVTIDLDAACAGVICDPSQTCAQGSCVSAETRCDDEGDCVLASEPQGGGGGGGGGPVGGEGGGGAGPDPWTPLWTPETSVCGGSPSDVVADVVGARLHVFVPTGRCMVDLVVGEPPVEHGPMPAPSANSYRAVAKGRTDVLAFGDIGLTRSQSVPPFSEFDIALPSFDPAAVGATWDVAFYDLPSSVAWARTYQDFSGPSAHIAPFLPSLLDGGFKPALFTTFAMSDMLSDPIAFGAWESTIAVRRSGLTETFPATGADGWTLWAEERAGVKGTVQLVAIGGSTEAAWVGSCADASGGADPNCSFAVDPLHQLDTSTPPRKVTAIWGIQRGADIDVYAVGNDVAPWLGVARLPTDPLQTLDWAYAPLPAPMQQAGGIVSSVWVGLDENENETLIVVGSSGVFAADPNALSFTPP